MLGKRKDLQGKTSGKGSLPWITITLITIISVLDYQLFIEGHWKLTAPFLLKGAIHLIALSCICFVGNNYLLSTGHKTTLRKIWLRAYAGVICLVILLGIDHYYLNVLTRGVTFHLHLMLFFLTPLPFLVMFLMIKVSPRELTNVSSKPGDANRRHY